MTLARTLGVVGASGGIGASTLTAMIGARFAAAGGRAVCLDGNRLGGGLDVVLGLDHEPGLRWREAVRVGEVAGGRLRRALPGTDALSVLSFDRGTPVEPPPQAWEAVLTSLRSEADLLVVDLPAPADPGLPDLVGRLDDVVLLVGDSPPALAAASVAFAALDAHVDRWWLAQRTARGSDELPEAVATALDIPLLLAWPHDPRVPHDLARGVAPGRGRAGAATSAALERLYGGRRRRSA